jgi:hypothetical protein
MRLGLTKLHGTLSEGGKVMARASLIQKGMGDAQGDHARTANQFANAWRELAGRVTDFGQTLGSVALPYLTGFLRALSPIAEVLQWMAHTLKDVTAGVGKFASAVGSGIFGEAAETIQPGGGAGKDLGPAAPGGGSAAAPGGVLKFGMDAARKHVADEAAEAAQDRLVRKARDEKAEEDRRKMIAAANEGMHKHDTVQRWLRSAGPETAMNARDVREAEQAYDRLVSPLDRNGKPKNAVDARIRENFLAEGQKTDSKPARDALDAAKSFAKDYLGQGFGFAQALKQQALNVTGKGFNMVDAAGEAARRKREETEARPFRSEYLSNTGLSERIQSAALSKEGNKKEEKEIARDMARAVTELQNGFAALNGTLKQLRGVALYQ